VVRIITDNRAQFTLEAILVSFLAIFIILSFFNLNWERFYLAREVGEAGEIKMAGELLAMSINNAYANGEGFSIYISAEVLNYTKLRDTSAITGLGLSAITVDPSSGKIVLSKDVAKTGGGVWNTSMPIIPRNIIRQDPTTQYPETTILNTGSSVVIYANAGNIDVTGG
jgi:hypothetical protein